MLVAALTPVAAGQTPASQSPLPLDQQLPVDGAVRTGQFANGLRYYIRRNARPANRVSLRLAVNGELDELKSLLAAPLLRLNEGGRAGVISFHSLEDRIVKWRFRELAEGDFTILTKKPLTPSEEEERENPRSRSAKLRIIERGTAP